MERRFPHPQFKKVVTGYKKFYAHDEKSEAKIGDRVLHRGNPPALQNEALALDRGGREKRSSGVLRRLTALIKD